MVVKTITTNIIETKNLTKNFGKTTAVNSINMHVKKGEIYALIGRNGAGKTTTLSMLLNLSKPKDGEIKIFGLDNRKNQEIYKKIGSLIETPGFYENLTAEENLTLMAKLRGDYNKENIKKAIKSLGLEDQTKKQYKNYSLGMKQRLGIAATIVHNPELLILDEPINALDPISIHEIRLFLKKLSQEHNITILISSHILSEVEQIADTIGIIDNGELIQEISMDEITQQKEEYVEFEISNNNNIETILEKFNLNKDKDYKIKKIGHNGKTCYKLRLCSKLNERAKINTALVKEGIEVSKIKLVEDSLEDYFMKQLGVEL